MNKRLKALFVLVFVLAANVNSLAQYRTSPFAPGSRKSKLAEIGFVATPVYIIAGARYLDANMNVKTASAKAILASSYGFNIGSGARIAQLGENNSLDFNLALMGTFTNADISGKTLYMENKSRTFTNVVKLWSVYVPVGLDFKHGAEAATDKHLKTLFTLGGGISPRVTVSAGEMKAITIKYPLFVKAEVGYHLGIAMKIRAMYFIGQQKWHEDLLSDITLLTQGQTYQLTSNGSFLISLIFMPFSFVWEGNY